jgi:hypothetical protein
LKFISKSVKNLVVKTARSGTKAIFALKTVTVVEGNQRLPHFFPLYISLFGNPVENLSEIVV